MNELDFVTRANPTYVDDMYRRYLRDPASVDERWALFFAGFEMAQGRNGRVPAARGDGGPSTSRRSGNGGAAALTVSPIESVAEAEVAAQARRSGYIPGLYDLVHSFRAFGHFTAKLDPLGANDDENPHLTEALSRFGEEDMDRVIEGAAGFKGAKDPTLRELIARLKTTYCGTFAVQYLHLPKKRSRLGFRSRWARRSTTPCRRARSASRS